MAYKIRYDPVPPRKGTAEALFAAGALLTAAVFLMGNPAPLKAGLTALFSGAGWYEAALVWCRMTLGLLPV